VAPLGTALGEEQIRLLWTLAAEPVLCLDGDRAGHSAAVRGAERALPLLQPGRSLRFARLPPGEDPDTLVRKGGAESIEALIESAESLASVIWQSEWERHAPTSPERRAAFHRSILGQVRRIGDETVRRYYEQSIRERLQDAFAPPSRPSGFRRGTRPQGSRWPEASGPSVHRRANPRRLAGQRQRTLLGILVLYPDLIEEFAEALAQLSFTDGALERLRNAILGVGAVLNDLDAGSIASQLSTTTGHQSVNWEREVRPLLASACEDARAALGGASIDGQEALMRARGAADQLVRALEQDTVRADVAGQIDGLSEAPDTLDRLKAIVAAERLRAPTEP